MDKDKLYIKSQNHDVITMYIARGTPFQKALDLLKREEPIVSNIKSRVTRQAIQRSFQKIKSFLLNPPLSSNGYILVASEHDFAWTNDLMVDRDLYRCGDEFYSHPLEEQLALRLYPIGIITLDSKEATLAYVSNKIQILKAMTSGIPGKSKKGGQCLSPDSLIFLSKGEIRKIKDLTLGEKIKGINLDSKRILDTEVLDIFHHKGRVYQLITKYPRFVIEASENHSFFVWEKGKIKEKPVKEIEEGTFLLFPEEIDHKSFNSFSPQLAQFLGYFIGDGNFDGNRLVLSEGNKKLADYYYQLIAKTFKITPTCKFRTKKNYYETRIYSKRLVESLTKNFFSEGKEKIPYQILEADNRVFSSFLRGIFDAEGYLDRTSIGITMANKFLIHSLQLALLRFGILSSFSSKNISKNPYSRKSQFTLVISEKQSLESFKKYINFSSNPKRKKLKLLERMMKDKSLSRKVLIDGEALKSILKREGLTLYKQFPRVSNYFQGKRNMSKITFRNSILKNLKSYPKLKMQLETLLKHSLIPVIVKEKRKANVEDMIDITTSCGNFIANGLIVHNSQRRFERERDMEIANWFSRIGDAAKVLVDVYPIEELYISGPGFTKNQFLDAKYLDYRLKEKVKGILDTQYTDESGIRETLHKALPMLEKNAYAKEVQIVEDFFELMGKNFDRITYGQKDIESNLGKITKIIQLEEITLKYPVETVILHFKGEHYEKIKSLGGICGIK